MTDEESMGRYYAMVEREQQKLRERRRKAGELRRNLMDSSAGIKTVEPTGAALGEVMTYDLSVWDSAHQEEKDGTPIDGMTKQSSAVALSPLASPTTTKAAVSNIAMTKAATMLKRSANRAKRVVEERPPDEEQFFDFDQQGSTLIELKRDPKPKTVLLLPEAVEQSTTFKPVCRGSSAQKQRIHRSMSGSVQAVGRVRLPELKVQPHWKNPSAKVFIEKYPYTTNYNERPSHIVELTGARMAKTVKKYRVGKTIRDEKGHLRMEHTDVPKLVERSMLNRPRHASKLVYEALIPPRSLVLMDLEEENRFIAMAEADAEDREVAMKTMGTLISIEEKCNILTPAQRKLLEGRDRSWVRDSPFNVAQASALLHRHQGAIDAAPNTGKVNWKDVLKEQQLLDGIREVKDNAYTERLRAFTQHMSSAITEFNGYLDGQTATVDQLVLRPEIEFPKSGDAPETADSQQNNVDDEEEEVE